MGGTRCARAAAADCSRVAQLGLVLSLLLTSSMRRVGLGVLLLSASIEIGFQPHHCRIMESRYLPAAKVRSMC